MNRYELTDELVTLANIPATHDKDAIRIIREAGLVPDEEPSEFHYKGPNGEIIPIYQWFITPTRPIDLRRVIPK